MCSDGKATSNTRTVRVHGPVGSKPHPAVLDTVGDAPPKQVELPKGLTDDDAVANVAASDSDVCLCRLTLAKEFSPAPLFVKASASPHLLPALLLDEHRKHVLQTRGAVAYTPLRSHALS